MPLSVVLITYNAEQTIERCLKSVIEVADEIVVVDSNSTDQTIQLCKKYHARVIQQDFMGFGKQKQFATAQASHHHILSLDADEELTETLKCTILDIKNHFTEDCYSFNRLNFYCNKPIRHGGWYPDTQVRLYDRQQVNWNNRDVHETIEIHPGVKLKHLQGDLNHFTCRTIAEHQEKERKYARINADMLIKNGKTIAFFVPAFKGFFRFLKTYLIQLGLLDGYYGFIISKTVAHSSYLKYSMARKGFLD